MPIGTAAALLGSAVIGGATSMFGANSAREAGNTQAAAANNAAALQAAQSERALQLQREMYGDSLRRYEQTRGDLQPYMNMGTGAMGRLNDWYGLSGNANPERAMADFQNSPDYQVAQREGINALQNSAFSRGGMLGGRFGKDMMSFGADLGAKQFGNYRGFMTGMMGAGQQAATSLGGFGAQMSNASAGFGNSMANTLNQSGQYQGNALMGAGQAQASGTVGSANALTAGANNASNNLMLWTMMNRPGGASPVGGGGTGFGLNSGSGLY